jgi:glycolate dehydrogenase iron-sulfur subunit
LLKLFGLAELDALSPQIEDDFFFGQFGMMFFAAGERRGKVALLGGCIAGVAFAGLNRATIRVLQENGIEVHVPLDQGCCGALHAHAGFRESARKLARRNIRTFLEADYDAILTNAAGCGATMKEYTDLLKEDPEFRGKAAQFAARVKDVTEYLAALGLRKPSRLRHHRVTYQDPCHLAHGQGIRSAPRDLLKATGAELVEMPNPDYCCGSAGTYNVVENRLSMQILDAKMEDVAAVEPEIIATANVGCMLQLRAGVARRGLKAEVRHVIELLNDAY